MGDRDFDVDKCKNPSLKNFKESKDFFGIGLLNEPSDWTSYSYLIVPEITQPDMVNPEGREGEIEQDALDAPFILNWIGVIS